MNLDSAELYLECEKLLGININSIGATLYSIDVTSRSATWKFQNPPELKNVAKITVFVRLDTIVGDMVCIHGYLDTARQNAPPYKRVDVFVSNRHTKEFNCVVRQFSMAGITKEIKESCLKDAYSTAFAILDSTDAALV